MAVAFELFSNEPRTKVFHAFNKYLRSFLPIKHGVEIFRSHSVYGSSSQFEKTFNNPSRRIFFKFLGVMVFVFVRNECDVGSTGAGERKITSHQARLAQALFVSNVAVTICGCHELRHQPIYYQMLEIDGSI